MAGGRRQSWHVAKSDRLKWEQALILLEVLQSSLAARSNVARANGSMGWQHPMRDAFRGGQDMTVNKAALDVPAAGPTGDALARNRFDSILETIGRTPVVRIKKLAPAHVALYVKIEAFNPMGSVKDRLALGIIEDAERAGQLKPGQTVVEATSGNTGIGFAMGGAQKGYRRGLARAETFSVERRKLMRFLGAKVVLTPAAQRGMGMVAKAMELAKARGWFLTRQFENEANPDMHSRTTAREIF